MLPVEIIRLVIEHVDWDTLAPCALVHSSWREPSQRLRFKHVTVSSTALRSRDRSVPFTERWDSVSERLKYTTSLRFSIDTPNCREDDFFVDDESLELQRMLVMDAMRALSQLGALLPNLSRLVLATGGADLYSDGAVEVLRGFRGLSAVGFEGISFQDICALLEKLPSVDEITLDRVASKDSLRGRVHTDVSSPRIGPRPSLRSLKMESTMTSSMLRSLYNSGLIGSLQRLDITVLSGYNQSMAPQTRLVLDNLHDLRVTFDMRPTYDLLRPFWRECALAAWVPITQHPLSLTVVVARPSTLFMALKGLFCANVHELRVELRETTPPVSAGYGVLSDLTTHVDLPRLARVDLYAALHRQNDGAELSAAFECWARQGLLTNCIRYLPVLSGGPSNGQSSLVEGLIPFE